MGEALGMVETKGMVPLVQATDAMPLDAGSNADALPPGADADAMLPAGDADAMSPGTATDAMPSDADASPPRGDAEVAPDAQVPSPLPPSPKQLVLGRAHGCSLDPAISGVICWGDNRHGQTKVPSLSSEPVKVPEF